MTDDQILELAAEVGIKAPTEQLIDFANSVMLVEREVNALMVEEFGMEGYGTLAIAALIRRRK